MLKILVTSVLLACGAQLAFAQKVIILSDSLTADADILPVTFATSGRSAFMKFPRLSFGDYKVVSGKWSFPLATPKYSRKFSFILTGNATDSVKVNGVLKTVSKDRSPVQVSNHLVIGGYYHMDSVSFSANIAVTGDTAHLWTLSIKTKTIGDKTVKYKAFLTDGKRNILITPVRTTQSALPDYGYEFAENGRFYSAYQWTKGVQYYRNSYKIYLEKSLDPKMKLLLSGAMVAIFELKDQ